MGLSIHYKGNFRAKASLTEMIEEVKDISEIHKWKYHIFEREFPENNLGKKFFDKNIYGILFSPPECEPVELCFFSNGKMANPFMYDIYLKSKRKEDLRLASRNATKTQYAGIEVHKKIIKLLKHISKKYLKNFTLIDEGKYWETGDEKLLEEIFGRYDTLITSFANALEDNKKDSGETLEEYITGIAKKVNIKRKQ